MATIILKNYGDYNRALLNRQLAKYYPNPEKNTDSKRGICTSVGLVAIFIGLIFIIITLVLREHW